MPQTRPVTSAEGDLLAALFHPRSIAIVGISGKEVSLTSRPLQYLLRSEFAGALYPVNPNYEELRGLKCYPSLASIGAPVDLVLSMVPAAGVVDVVRQAGEVAAKAVVVFASGFAEIGPDGAALQQELAEAARAANVRVLGPNCQGVINNETGLIGTFTGAADRPLPPPSGVAYVGQSGAIGGSVLDLSTEMGLGLTAWASTGNQADLSLVEVATALLDDDGVRVVLLYAEGITDGASFVALAAKAHSRGKRLVMLRSGRSSVGRKAAASHTGAMLGDDISLVLTAQAYGVILVDDVDELLAVGAALASTTPMVGRRVGIVTTSGGAGILAADHFELNGIGVPELAEVTQTALEIDVPDFGATSNPVDVTAQILNKPNGTAAFGEVCKTVARDESVDAVCVVLTMVTGERGARLADAVVEASRTAGKPVFVSWLAGREQTTEGRAVYREHGFPVFASVGDVARTIGHIAPTANDLGVRAVKSAREPEGNAGELRALTEACAAGDAESEDLLDALGIARPRSVLARNAAEAAQAAAEMGGQVVLKVHAPDLAHKSDVGGVVLGVAAEDSGVEYDRLMGIAAANGIDAAGVLVQEMIPTGVELIVGATSTGDGFPATVTVGIGGVTTEIYQDVISQIAPVTAEVARRMLEKLRGWPLLDGFRGAPVADIESAVDAIVAVGRLIEQFADRVIEFEINPLIVAPKGRGACAVDVLISATPA
ncbi:acyl-CoA synthetase (NDP forming) [Antricoccus suffuscus]|uniref:Acyl-CoA synthetase (NDP forming) n=1 Tax=Antricoccus suffuscus TaxID=1629062 RepID=A0A2T1A1Q9_9ACTN|nr:acetate--CoA ligase [Antricoccus suffuscus]PRZ42427.1 acyl-CoA synthetase (NDP forming) [Antricoccus suffuscus]